MTQAQIDAMCFEARPAWNTSALWASDPRFHAHPRPRGPASGDFL